MKKNFKYKNLKFVGCKQLKIIINILTKIKFRLNIFINKIKSNKIQLIGKLYIANNLYNNQNNL